MNDYRHMIEGVYNIPSVDRSAKFKVDSASVFREDEEISARKLQIGKKTLEYMPWGGDDLMPYKILDLIERDETLNTCLMWNAQMCYGSGLQYNTEVCTPAVASAVDSFLLDNQLSAYFMGVAQDLKHWGFSVSVIVLSNDRKSIVRLYRKEAMYCRFTPADANGNLTTVLYANWRSLTSPNNIEVIPLLNELAPFDDLKERIDAKKNVFKFAILTRFPTADHTYYPIPYWASIFRSKWYNIKQHIATAKEAKIKNTAPLKYLVEISDKYFDRIFRREHITDKKKQIERVNQEKQNILDFLTGAENSGKTWFSNFYVSPDGKEQHEVVVTKIDSSKEGGDWESDIQEAVNMICFTLQVHSNLVGSVPGKSQTNNSGSDKRELYTIAQALQKPYHDLMFGVHNLIIRFNGWKAVKVVVPFIQLTTLDENTDAKKVTIEQ